MTRTLACTLPALAAAGLMAALAQTTIAPGKLLEFDVATVKPSAPDERNSSMELQPNGGLRMRNTTLKQLIATAYQLRDFQISGGPGWISTDHFDIEAKSEAPAVPLDLKKMTDAQLKEMDRQFKKAAEVLAGGAVPVNCPGRDQRDAPLLADASEGRLKADARQRFGQQQPEYADQSRSDDGCIGACRFACIHAFEYCEQAGNR